MIQSLKQYRAPIEEQFQKMKENAEKLNEKMEAIPELVEEEVKKEEEPNKNENTEKKEVQKQEKYEFFEELLALKGAKIKIIPIFEDIEKISEKKKFQNLFDLVLLGFVHGAYIKKPEFPRILKKNGEVLVENAHFLVPLKAKERDDLNEKLVECGKALNFANKVFSKKYYTRFILE